MLREVTLEAQHLVPLDFLILSDGNGPSGFLTPMPEFTDYIIAQDTNPGNPLTYLLNFY